MKLALGGAQLGMSYGITNSQGRVSAAALAEILSHTPDLTMIDTAPAYGLSEERLGAALADMHGKTFRVITKTPTFETAQNIGRAELNSLADTFEQSLSLLRQPSIYALLVHNANALLKPGADAVFERLLDWKKANLIQKVGITAYTQNQVDAVLERFPIDIVQVPLHVMDQRLVVSGALKRWAQNGVEIHARSVFLQGLLIETPGPDSPSHGLRQKFAPAFATYSHWLQRHQLSPAAACLGFVSQVPWVEHAVCGVTTTAEWRELQGTLAEAQTHREWQSLPWHELAQTDESLLNPMHWPPRPSERPIVEGDSP